MVCWCRCVVHIIELQERCCISLIVFHLWLANSARECGLALCVQ